MQIQHLPPFPWTSFSVLMESICSGPVRHSNGSSPGLPDHLRQANHRIRKSSEIKQKTFDLQFRKICALKEIFFSLFFFESSSLVESPLNHLHLFQLIYLSVGVGGDCNLRIFLWLQSTYMRLNRPISFHQYKSVLLLSNIQWRDL